eukprot:TRINITY_DN271_c0_g1_i4.p2 TRINITY_DN271_c0_g1~~TRINITY_DN271_c0_g1_i4.p2  ORF type:complete len:109 (-),score=37.22 TRINITY_DN271_c0_g1_i4:6-332(-)
MCIRDSNQRVQLREIEKAHQGSIHSMVISSDSSKVITGASDGKIKVRSLPEGNLLYEIEHNPAISTMTLTLSQGDKYLSLIHISEPTRQAEISYAVFCLKKKKYIFSI